MFLQSAAGNNLFANAVHTYVPSINYTYGLQGCVLAASFIVELILYILALLETLLKW